MDGNAYKMLKVKKAVEALLVKGVDVYSNNENYKPYERHFMFYRDVKEALHDLFEARIVDLWSVTNRSNSIELQFTAYGHRTRITYFLPPDLLRPVEIPQTAELLPDPDYKLLREQA